MDQIRVHVVNRGRRFWYLRYTDPVTGKPVEKSSGCTSKKDAVKAAGKWEAELREGRYKPASKITWDEFWERYDSEIMPGFADRTQEKVMCLRAVAEQEMSPTKIADITTSWLSTFCARMRERGCSEATIDGYLRHLGSAMTRAVEWGMLRTRPKFPTGPRRRNTKRSKGRPITGEEFERMLDKVPSVVYHVAVESWRHYLRGLWLSGLRLGESLNLYWDRDDRLRVDLAGRRPMLWIPGALQKSGKDEILPITPDFAEFLLETPPERRSGRVFNPVGSRSPGSRISNDRVIRTVSAIGRAANVVVHTHPTTGAVKYASAHDLRRSFGNRWAMRIPPALLQKLMRHEQIQTSMHYYVEVNAHETADALWNSWKSDTSGDTSPETVENPAEFRY